MKSFLLSLIVLSVVFGACSFIDSNCSKNTCGFIDSKNSINNRRNLISMVVKHYREIRLPQRNLSANDTIRMYFIASLEDWGKDTILSLSGATYYDELHLTFPPDSKIDSSKLYIPLGVINVAGDWVTLYSLPEKFSPDYLKVWIGDQSLTQNEEIRNDTICHKIDYHLLCGYRQMGDSIVLISSNLVDN